jgi:hypothetical protein
MNGSNRIDLAALLLRGPLGVMFIADALLKYLVFTGAGIVVGLLGGGRFALAARRPSRRAAFRLQRAD